MIRYALRCEHEHEFDGWFPSSADFEIQAGSGDLRCPVCGSADVRKALMAPGLGRGTRKSVKRDDVSIVPDAAAKMTTMLLALKKHVEENCDYVGDKFAEEARRIHYGETGRRDIYGETTPEEARDLIDEGVEVAPLPIVPPARAN